MTWQYFLNSSIENFAVSFQNYFVLEFPTYSKYAIKSVYKISFSHLFQAEIANDYSWIKIMASVYPFLL